MTDRLLLSEGECERLCAAWGAQIPQELLTLVFTHRSYAFEHDTPHNERLEFMGDSILGAVVSVYLYMTYPDKSEGDLSKIKAASVSAAALYEVAKKLGFGNYMFLGKGEEHTGGRQRESTLADVVEALIAATWLTHGTDVTQKVVLTHVLPLIERAALLGPALDWRTSLEEYARSHGITESISYHVDGVGPDHAKVYTAVVSLDREWGTGTATSSKFAKLAACRDAYYQMHSHFGDEPEPTSEEPPGKVH